MALLLFIGVVAVARATVIVVDGIRRRRRVAVGDGGGQTAHHHGRCLRGVVDIVSAVDAQTLRAVLREDASAAASAAAHAHGAEHEVRGRAEGRRVVGAGRHHVGDETRRSSAAAAQGQRRARDVDTLCQDKCVDLCRGGGHSDPPQTSRRF